MASSIANTVGASMVKTNSLLRVSFNFFRNLSSAANPTTAASTTEAAAKKPKRKKKKNLFEVAQFLPNWGIGYHMAKTHWTGLSYQITKLNLYKDGKHGKAWGIVHKEGGTRIRNSHCMPSLLSYPQGLPAADAPRKISGVHKRCWRYIPNSIKAEESTPKPEVQAA